MARYGIVVDVDKCNGCCSCFLACKDEYVGNNHLPVSLAQPEGQKWLRVNEVEHGTGMKVKVDYIPLMCQHCEDAPCMKVAPEGAVYRRADGIIVIDPEKAKGNKRIAESCPYGVVEWNESAKLAQKCTMCAHMLDKGEKTTRCAEVCPTEALIFGDMDDPNSQISKLIAEKGDKLEGYKTQFGTKPAVKYLNITKPFITGEVVFGDTGECAKGIKVTLSCKECGSISETKTDFLGDFEFKGLKQSTDYTVKVEAAGYKVFETNTRTNASKNLNELVLEKI
ncbi:MAG: oxidoreductase [Clostridiales bacterium]|nr:oxidoreductase [Clostridiales bacterium]